ncbi:uncharacterized protein [Pyrus communis]|uniref:uncharacterized protein isoform X2 n=1 Tax=Pyrus communis TaxID=23211 RepID=UPI0035BF86BD
MLSYPHELAKGTEWLLISGSRTNVTSGSSSIRRWKQKKNWRHPSVFQPKGGTMNWDPTIHHMLPSSTTFVGLRILRHPAALPVSMFRIMLIDPYQNGCNLSTAKTAKFSEICENGCVRYGLSSTQGWRTTMEDVLRLKQLVPATTRGFII